MLAKKGRWKKKKIPPSLSFFILFYLKEKSPKPAAVPRWLPAPEKNKREKKMDIVKLFKGSMNRFFRKTRQWCQLEMFALGVS